MDVVVRDAVVCCSLGNTEAEIVAALHHPKPLGNAEFSFGKEKRERLYGGINTHKVVGCNEFFDRLSGIIDEIIHKNSMSDEELEECALLIGSTSMNIPCSEAVYQRNPQDMLSSIGYGKIGETLAQRCRIGGEVTLFMSACTSSASALLYAQRGISTGRFKRAIVLGFEFYNEFTMSGFESLGLLSLQGCKPFDAERSGIILGEGCAAILVDSSIPKEGQFMRLLGGENRCDLFAPTSHNTDGVSVAETIEAALKDASVSPSQIGLIKTHGTGSYNNDTAEGRGMNAVFEKLPSVLALKPLLGHTLGGCGAIELGILWFALKSGFIPKSYGFSTLDETLQITPTQRVTAVDTEMNILINHFGFGGNGTVLVARYGGAK
jgi:3-oxoacyl-[acyl-carrier-protein] synthase I